MKEDPFFYRKFSMLLQQVTDEYKAQRISDAEYLKKTTEILNQVAEGLLISCSWVAVLAQAIRPRPNQHANWAKQS